MLNGIYQNATTMSGLETWNNAIAQNLAQSATPGYKKATLAFEGVANGSIAYQGSFENTLQHNAIAATGKAGVDFSSGNIIATDIQTDFALEGNGFFELRAPDGQLVYTRDGQFRLNENGELVSKQGFYVMDEERNPIRLMPEGGDLKGEPDGTLVQEGRRIGKLAVRVANNPNNLLRSHGGFVIDPKTSSEPQLINPGETTVRHAALENSNVTSTLEMVDMINVSRAFQLNQQMIRGHDDLLGKAIQTLGGRA